MKFLLIIILQEPTEFGVTTSQPHAVGGGGYKCPRVLHFLLTTGPHPQLPKLGTFQTFITLVVSVISSLKLLFLSFT
jgi:hypothetical protein